MSEHTPTPWSIGERARLIVRDVPGMCDGGDSYAVAETRFHGLLFEEEAAANAAFIVKAVNNHDMLVKAMENLLRFCDDGTLYEKENPDKYSPYIAAREALAKVSACPVK